MLRFITSQRKILLLFGLYNVCEGVCVVLRVCVCVSFKGLCVALKVCVCRSKGVCNLTGLDAGLFPQIWSCCSQLRRSSVEGLAKETL